jgi:HEAT repeat protein
MIRKFTIMLAVASLLAPMAAGDVWQDLAKYEYGDASDTAKKAHLLLQDTPVAEHAAIEKTLIGVISAKDATQAGKSFACRSLQQIGTEKSIPALSALLGDKVLTHYARLALEMIDSPKASAALLTALPKVDDKLKAGIIMSLGNRKEKTAVKAIAASLGCKEAGTAAAAMRSLAMIGGKDAAKCLIGASPTGALAPVHMESLIVCGESLEKAEAAKICTAIYTNPAISAPSRLAALRGLARADGPAAAPLIVKEIKGKPGYMKSGALRIVASDQCKCLTGVVSKALASMAPADQVKTLDVLGQRGDIGALEGVSALYGSDSADVKLAAYTAAGRIGDTDCIKTLVEMEALGALAIIANPKVDAILAGMISDPKLGPGAINALSKRGSTTAAPALVKMIESGSTQTKIAGWGAMANLASDKDLDSLMKLIVKVTDDKVLAAATNAIKNICTNSGDRRKCFDSIGPLYAQADKKVKTLIVTLGSATGGVKAVAVVKEALKSSDADIRAAAMRSLMNWPDTGAADTLLEIAKNGKTDKDKILATRGYIQVTSKEDERRRADMYKKIVPLATRSDEKNLIISGLRNIRRSNINVLQTVAAYIADDSVKATAEQATIDVANRIKRDKRIHKKILPFIKSIKETSKNKNNVKRASQLYKELGGK